MILAKVVGNVVATQKQECYNGLKLLLVRETDPEGNVHGPEILVADNAMSPCIGDIVLIIAEGGSSRSILGIEEGIFPIELAVAGIVDRVDSIQGSMNQFKTKQ